MNPINGNQFWTYLEKIVADHQVVIDRPKGSTHPRYPDITYPLDYGYLEGTTSNDLGGIDVWIGHTETKNGSRSSRRVISAVLLTVDVFKNDAEIKIALDCNEEEIQTILSFHNSNKMGVMVVRRTVFV